MSLNPFTRQREKREEKLEAKLEELKAAQAAPPLSAPMADPAPASAWTPGREVDYEAEDMNKYLPASAQVEQAAPTWQSRPTNYYEPPSRAWQCVSKLQSGFMIGGALGGAFGFLYGTFAAIKYKHVLYLPIAVLQAGGAFGFFLACGTVIRCEEPPLALHPPAAGEERPRTA
uniref:Reactive oxygen species modulator 1 n=1 Tax=Emiliania huxleyi TaxID=2903 RepID=A0A6V2NDU2_EMIHU|mmetsp:Transcript_18472/g.54265  ORF Transcript_18472/g.54265 Transcript_18472/m.54265 type:complete len:173 (+) Transcript_18472:62-580(+)